MSAIHAKSTVHLQDDSQYRAKILHLKELFPDYSNEDLGSVLNDVAGDLDLAATRVAEGKVEIWSSVSRKADKKTPSSSKPVPTRGDHRGARGGRGGRGGPGRGGAVARGRGGPPRGGANGTAPRSPAPVIVDPPADSAVQDASPKQEEAIPTSTSGWTDASSQPETSTTATSISGGGSWGAEPAAIAKPPPVAQKRSWAQVAKPREKPAPPPVQPTHPAPAPAPSQPLHDTEPEPLPEPTQPQEEQGWEEPTTVEAPTWEEEAPSNPPQGWPPSTTTAEAPPVEEPKVEPPSPVVSEPKPEVKEEAPVEPPAEEPKPSAPVPPPVAASPSPRLTTRPAAVSHRSGPRYKIPDQAVTLPSSYGANVEKVGMQFGSLNLNGEIVEPSNEPEPSPPSEPAPAPAPVPAPVVPTPSKPEAPSAPPATAPASTSSHLTSVFQQQQAAPQATAHPNIPTSVSQPIQSTQLQNNHTPLQSFAQPSALAPPHHQPAPQPQHVSHLPQQLQQSHHSYTQIGLGSHLEQQQTQPAAQTPVHSSYLRQTEPASTVPYFHTPTPPAAQAPEHPYGSFGQLGAQGQHQQGTPLGGFGASDYTYSDSPRAFYDSYGPQQHAGYRGHEDTKSLPVQQAAANSLPPTNNQSAPQHASQTAQQTQQAGGQGPQQAYPPPVPYYYTHAYPQNQYYGSPYGSGYVAQPFVKFPPVFQPGPGGPTSATTPTNKQPGANIGVGVQPPPNPYNQSLYQQGSYEEYSHPHHSQHQHQHSHNLGLNQSVGVGSGEYGKVYGGAGQGGVQGFMGLSGQSGAGAGGPASNAGPRSGTSPEAAYKPYAKDVGVGAGRGGPSVQQGNQGQGQGGPPNQGFYGGNRFGSGVGNSASASAGSGIGGGVGGGGGGPQQTPHHQQGGPQGHLGYPQGGNDPSFYGYQPRQGQAYWQ